MDDEKTYLAKIRLERANELYIEAYENYNNKHYKTANNRLFYALEKSMKALLSQIGVDSSSHTGVLRQFNYHFIHQGDGTFTSNDYRIISNVEQIRNSSDYDDFYLASKKDTLHNLKISKEFILRVNNYICQNSNISIDSFENMLKNLPRDEHNI